MTKAPRRARPTRILALLAALPLAGCLGGAQQPPMAQTAEDWLAPDARLLTVAWHDPPVVDAPVRLTTDAARDAADGVVRVTVENEGATGLAYQGTSCSVLFARPEGDRWRVFAAASGNFLEVAQGIAPGEGCAADVDLARAVAVEDGRLVRATFPPGPYRIAFLADAGGRTVLASAPLHVE